MAWCVERVWYGVRGFWRGLGGFVRLCHGAERVREGVAWCGMVLGGYGMAWVMKDDVDI